MDAQETLNSHPTAKVAYVNEAGEWHFSTPPVGFVVVKTLTKAEPKELTKSVTEETEESNKRKNKRNGRT